MSIGERGGTFAVYETGKLVESVRGVGNNMSVTYWDLEDQSSNILAADIVIAADGVHSTVRKTLFPDLTPEYAGYVTWRGVVPENKVSENTT